MSKYDVKIWRMYRPQSPGELAGYLVTRDAGDLSDPIIKAEEDEELGISWEKALRIARMYARNPEETTYQTRVVWFSRKHRHTGAPPWMMDYVYICGSLVGCYLGPFKSLVCELPAACPKQLTRKAA